jgi:hypothetical protein
LRLWYEDHQRVTTSCSNFFGCWPKLSTVLGIRVAFHSPAWTDWSMLWLISTFSLQLQLPLHFLLTAQENDD